MPWENKITLYDDGECEFCYGEFWDGRKGIGESADDARPSLGFKWKAFRKAYIVLPFPNEIIKVLENKEHARIENIKKAKLKLTN